MKKSIIYLALFSILFSGCAARRQLTQDDREYGNRVMMSPLSFSVANDKVDDLWGKAQVWITQYGSMKIQTVTDYIIQTYTAVGGYVPRYGYSITKTPMGDNCQISITCQSNNMFSKKQVFQNAHVLSHYLQTGEFRAHFVSR